MNTAILYTTMTGHSKKLATAIAEATKAPAFCLEQGAVIEGYDRLFIVCGIYGGAVKPELITYAQSLTTANAKSVAIISSSTLGKSQCSVLRELLQANGIDVLEKEYSCFGSFFIAKLGHPNKSEIANAIQFVKENS